MLETPGPSEYIADVTRDIGKNMAGGDKRPFNVNTNRFGSDENGIPGALDSVHNFNAEWDPQSNFS